METETITQVEHDVPFKLDVYKGLTSSPKEISSKYFYDDEGSLIFQEITQMEEYYPTRLEMDVFKRNKSAIVERVEAEHVDVVELGAGDGHKTKVLLEEMVSKKKLTRFFPIDISEKAIRELLKNIGASERLEVRPVVGDFFKGLDQVVSHSTNPKLALFLGSNIGNFGPEERISFLTNLKQALRPGDMLLIGFDLKKDINKLMNAYDDPHGVTKRFNLNLLKRINRELGGNFDLESFHHHAFYNPRKGAMESSLLSLKEQDVYIEEYGVSFHFDAFEPILLEHSYKFTMTEINTMAKACGFFTVENFFDSTNGYVNSLWKVNSEAHFH
ncbi:MAG: L-histidine N(alpha)-methyltransferase [Halobacteriovoraceae bacterium]|nr:L-histidine N(alpha)-methyltransferase [Halobacteriovoraceae bacterium]